MCGLIFFFQAEDGIRDVAVTGVQTCALPICELSLYTSAQADDLGAVAKAFEQKYGVKVNMWRAGSGKVVQRAVTEARGGRFTGDVIATNGPGMGMLHREQLVPRVKAPHPAHPMPAAIRPPG